MVLPRSIAFVLKRSLLLGLECPIFANDMQ